jgi:hypothetical protein
MTQEFDLTKELSTTEEFDLIDELEHEDEELPRQGEWPCQRPPLSAADAPPRLVSFLYLLLRDHLGAGVVEETLLKIRRDDEDMHYTNTYLEGLARSHAQYLLEVSP